MCTVTSFWASREVIHGGKGTEFINLTKQFVKTTDLLNYLVNVLRYSFLKFMQSSEMTLYCTSVILYDIKLFLKLE